jgi:flagellar basal body P-ring formation protein FlgA
MNLWVFLVSMLVHSGPCQTIGADQISGADLARALPVFSSIPRDAVLGFSPSPGGRRVFTFPELEGIARKFSVIAPENAQACFEWPLQLLTEDAVRAAIRQTLQAPDARIEVLTMSKVQSPMGKLVFPLSGLSASTSIDPATPVTWRGEVLYHSSHKFTVWARVRVAATMTRVVATEMILPGHAVTSKQVRLETYDDFPLRNDIARSLDEVIGRVTRRALRAELPVFRTDLMEPYQIQRGETVQVTAISGATQLSLEAVAQNSGRQGDTISLKNERSGKVFLGRIEGKDRALVVVGPLAMSTSVQ